jgi:hypothetical protein
VKTAEQFLDVYNIEGSLAPFLLELPWYVPCPWMLNVFDFWRECFHEEVESRDEWDANWDVAQALWLKVEHCCKQAERMMALQGSYERCLSIYATHIKNMTPLLVELRTAMIKCGCNFPELKHTASASDLHTKDN